jgi:glucose-1-phosphate thymidylyltransferase
MKAKGVRFKPGQVTEWLDCGNKNATVYTNQRVLEFNKGKKELRGSNIQNTNSIIIEPCYIGNNVKLFDSIIGPHVSIGDNTEVTHSIVKNSIIQREAKIRHANIADSMLGSGAEVSGRSLDLSISDYTQVVA